MMRHKQHTDAETKAHLFADTAAPEAGCSTGGAAQEPAEQLASLLASLEAAVAGAGLETSAPRRGAQDDEEGVLAHILAPHLAREEEQAFTDQQRLSAYLADLRLVIRQPGGAGLRVLRHWLDESCAFARLHGPAPQIYATTALADFARDRMAEIALADPAGHLHVQLIGARQWARGMHLRERAPS